MKIETKIWKDAIKLKEEENWDERYVIRKIGNDILKLAKELKRLKINSKIKALKDE